MGQRFNLWRQNVKRNPIFTRLPGVYNILHRLLWEFLLPLSLLQCQILGQNPSSPTKNKELSSRISLNRG